MCRLLLLGSLSCTCKEMLTVNMPPPRHVLRAAMLRRTTSNIPVIANRHRVRFLDQLVSSLYIHHPTSTHAAFSSGVNKNLPATRAQWQIPVAVQCVLLIPRSLLEFSCFTRFIPINLMIMMMYFMIETPRWLVLKAAGRWPIVGYPYRMSALNRH